MSVILDNIEIEIDHLISHMRIAGGYNFDWTTSNEEDDAYAGFPRAIIDPRDTMADKETCMDISLGLGSQDYTNEVLFTILVTGDLPAFNNNPSFAIRSTMRKALDDLKKVFGVNNQLRGKCDNILYVSSQIEPTRKNDVLSAAQLRAVFKVIYSQDRQDPTLYASS
jgi:hypothetical protein